MSPIQQLLLGMYRLPFVSALLRTRVGSRLYVLCYDLYKDKLEAAGSGALAAHIPPDSWVIDVGANIGFFTERFAQWTQGAGRVIAIEPDSENLLVLRRRIAQAGLAGIMVHQAVAAERSGMMWLQRNPQQPSDHRIAEAGDPVAAVTLDEVVEQAGNPIVGLIKIDTQGSEHRVLQGASKTLARCRPSLFLEVDDGALRANGSSAARLVADLQSQGYEFFKISPRGKEELASADSLTAPPEAGKPDYFDILCIAKSQGADAIRSGE